MAIKTGNDQVGREPLQSEHGSGTSAEVSAAGDLSEVRHEHKSRISDDEGQELLRRFIAGDQRALDEIIKVYSAMVFSVFLRMFRLPTEDGEDLFQEVLLQLVVKAAEIRNVRMWLLGTAFNQARKRVRRLIRDRTLVERYVQEMELDSGKADEDVVELLQAGLSRLQSSDRQLLSLIYLEGMKYQEVSARLGRPVGSIGPQRGRALKRLQNVITELENPAAALCKTKSTQPAYAVAA